MIELMKPEHQSMLKTLFLEDTPVRKREETPIVTEKQADVTEWYEILSHVIDLGIGYDSILNKILAKLV